VIRPEVYFRPPISGEICALAGAACRVSTPKCTLHGFTDDVGA
jgi:hypothetical protein